MKRSKWTFLLLFCFSKFVIGQTNSLVAGPGDLLHILIFDTPELAEDVRVADDGFITLMMGTHVHVSMLAPAEVAKAVQNALIKDGIMLHPRVAVTITQYATQSVSVFGQVVHPGLYPVLAPRPILEVLSAAGGLTDLADRHITLKERSTGRLIPYFVSNQADVALDTQVMVYPGDSIDVARVGIVYVLGDVGRPGGYPMATNRSRITVLEATAIAGGTNKTAVPAHAKLIHKTNDGFQEIDIDLSGMQKGQVADRYLEADDILYIPFSYLKNFAVGADGLVAAAATAAIYHF